MEDAITQEASFGLTGSSASRGARGRAAHLLATLIFYALLALIIAVAIPYGTVEPWWEALFECLVFILAALWIVECSLVGSWHLPSYRLLWPLLALVAFALIQTVPVGSAGTGALRAEGGVWHAVSADPQGTRRWIAGMMALILLGIMLLSYARDKRRLRALVSLVIGVGLASALFGLLRQTTQHQAGFVLPYLMPGLGYGQFINKNHFAFLMEMALGLVLGLMIGGGVRRDRLLIYLSMALLLWTTLILSNSRGGILSMLCQLIFVGLLFPLVHRAPEAAEAHRGVTGWAERAGRSFVIRALLIICLIIVAGVGIVKVGGDPLLSNLEALPGEVSASGENVLRSGARRMDIWRATWRLIKAHPVAGVGFGGYWTAIPAYHDASGELTPQEAHNDYLELLASGGLVGAALSLWLIWVLVGEICAGFRRSPDRFSRAASFGALLGISGVAVHSLLDFGLHVTINAVIFVALIVIATARLDEQAVPGRKVYKQHPPTFS